MSAYYDLLEKPDIRRTGEQQPLYAHFVAKGTIDRKEFIDRVHLFAILQFLLNFISGMVKKPSIYLINVCTHISAHINNTIISANIN